MTVVVRRARIDEVFALRHAVLRPGRPEAASVYAQVKNAVHIGAWDDKMLVACATVFPDPWPDEPTAWRLRGMAVDPARQGTGIGRQVLEGAVAIAVAAGAPLMWANARSTALGFYESQGWRVAGPEFITADTGLPHKPIVLLLSTPPGT